MGISVEKNTRERAFVGVKQDFHMRHVETKQALEAMCSEVQKEQKTGFSQLTALVDQARGEFEKMITNATVPFEKSEEALVQKIDTVDGSITRRINDIMNVVNTMGRNLN